MMLLVSPEQWANWDKWFNYTLPGYILILGIIFFYSKSSVINDFKQFYFEIQA